MKQFVITTAMGKRLIGKGVAAMPAVRTAATEATLAIIAGSTNGYVAEEVLAAIGQAEGFSRVGFRRGFVSPPGFAARDAEPGRFEGDVIVTKGQWRRGKTVFDVGDDLKAGDVVLKGANAVDLKRRRAAILVGHPQLGTSAPAVAAAIGRRVRLIVPVGVEKRVAGPLEKLAEAVNDPAGTGPGMLVLPGEVFTELDAVALLTGAEAKLVAAGGIYGAEGAAWIAVTGNDEQVAAAEKLIASVANEPPCRV